MKASQILESARNLVAGDRNKQHGDKTINHAAIATMWDAYLTARAISDRGRQNAPLGPEDVANMMELLKVARRLNGTFNADDYIDGAGYAGVAGEIAADAANVSSS